MGFLWHPRKAVRCLKAAKVSTMTSPCLTELDTVDSVDTQGSFKNLMRPKLLQCTYGGKNLGTGPLGIEEPLQGPRADSIRALLLRNWMFEVGVAALQSV